MARVEEIQIARGEQGRGFVREEDSGLVGQEGEERQVLTGLLDHLEEENKRYSILMMHYGHLGQSQFVLVLDKATAA